MSKITVYTDGSCWNGEYRDQTRSASSVGLILNADLKFVDYLVSARNHGTSNRAEMNAILEAMEHGIINRFEEIDIITDSKYCIRVFAKGCIDKNIFFLRKFQWLETKIKTKLFHTKAHNGDTYNEIADEIAGITRKATDKLLNEHINLPRF